MKWILAIGGAGVLSSWSLANAADLPLKAPAPKAVYHFGYGGGSLGASTNLLSRRGSLLISRPQQSSSSRVSRGRPRAADYRMAILSKKRKAVSPVGLAFPCGGETAFTK